MNWFEGSVVLKSSSDPMHDLIWQVLILLMIVSIIWASQRIINVIERIARDLTTRAETAAEKAVKVKEELVQTTEAFNKKLTEIHILVNSNMAIQLKTNAELSRWKANHTKDDPNHEEFVKQVDRAERLYKEHIDHQAEVDRLVKPVN
jgi:hypothetical protein